jgi:thiamine biosynthesis lipoprotein
MGTVFSFDVRAEPTRGLRRALAEAAAWLHHVDAVFSTYRPDSQISRLDRGEAALTDCDPDVAEVLRLCDEAARVSGRRFSVRADGRLDPSAVVKGWAIERGAQMLSRAGARDHCVNGGGDLQLTGGTGPDRPWRIGVAHPLLPGRLATVVTGRDLAVATSGTAERGHHIVDPRTGLPATALASVSLVGRDLTTVDALATAAFVMGESAREWVEDGLAGIEAFAVTADGRTWWTTGFPHYGIVPR